MRLRFLMLWSGVATLLLAILVPFSNSAEKALPIDRLTNGSRVRVAFEPSIATVRPLIVQVLLNEHPVALGMAVTADGLLITKASEIDPVHRLTIKQGKETHPARVVGWSDAHDLALLKTDKSGWSTPNWHMGADPAVGQFLVTPGTEKTPIAVGVVSVPRRAVEKDETRGVLGVELASAEGAIIEDMFEQSAARAAGVRVGDEITRVDTVAIRSSRDLVHEIAKHTPGETVVLEIRRNGKVVVISVTLGHPFGTFLSRIAQQNRLGGEISRRASGFPTVIQHDSTLKPEECGGPAVNIDGQIVGINIARSGRTESLMIPTSVVQEVLQSFREGKLPQLRSTSPATPPPPTDAEPIE